MTERDGSSYWDWDLLRPGYVDKLRAREPHDLLRAHRGLCGLAALVGLVLLTLEDASKPASAPPDVRSYAVFVTLALISITAHAALQPGGRLRPIAALRGHALALFGVAVVLVAELTEVALLAPKPPAGYHWLPFVSALTFTYSAALAAATWSARPWRHLSTVLGPLAVAWEAYLATRLFIPSWF